MTPNFSDNLIYSMKKQINILSNQKSAFKITRKPHFIMHENDKKLS
jgi:hypothetical protein